MNNETNTTHANKMQVGLNVISFKKCHKEYLFITSKDIMVFDSGGHGDHGLLC